VKIKRAFTLLVLLLAIFTFNSSLALDTTIAPTSEFGLYLNYICGNNVIFGKGDMNIGDYLVTKKSLLIL
jgi:hypothetical protein